MGCAVSPAGRRRVTRQAPMRHPKPWPHFVVLPGASRASQGPLGPPRGLPRASQGPGRIDKTNLRQKTRQVTVPVLFVAQAATSSQGSASKQKRWARLHLNKHEKPRARPSPNLEKGSTQPKLARRVHLFRVRGI